MERESFITADGSASFRVPELGEAYHSIHGAFTESQHIYIENGLKLAQGDPLRVFEMGFGTALNAYLTYMHALENQKQVQYFAVEKYPLMVAETESLNYPDLLHLSKEAFTYLHACEWNMEHQLGNFFTLNKDHNDIRNARIPDSLNLVYYDAFAPEVQPELWTEEIFSKLYLCLLTEGILVTYSAKGLVKRNLEACGFQVLRVPGPPGKREIIRATKK